MDEQPDDSDWLRPPGSLPSKSPPVIFSDTSVNESRDDDTWYDVSERGEEDP
jgi:hypothetical protein